MKEKKTKAFWTLIIINIILTLWYLLGQTLAVFDYDATVEMGLQDHPDAVTAVGVAFGRGFGLGDTLIYIPLLLAGIIGLLKRKTWGVYSMFGAMSVTVYWPIVCLGAVYFAKGAPGWGLTAYLEYSIVLPVITLFGIWGMYYTYSKRKELSGEG